MKGLPSRRRSESTARHCEMHKMDEVCERPADRPSRPANQQRACALEIADVSSPRTFPPSVWACGYAAVRLERGGAALCSHMHPCRPVAHTVLYSMSCRHPPTGPAKGVNFVESRLQYRSIHYGSTLRGSTARFSCAVCRSNQTKEELFEIFLNRELWKSPKFNLCAPPLLLPAGRQLPNRTAS